MQYHPPSWLPASENGKRTDYYAHLRTEVIEVIPEGCAVVLDVGCGKGTLGRWLKEQPGVTTVYGAELFPAAGEDARRWEGGRRRRNPRRRSAGPSPRNGPQTRRAPKRIAGS
jgi:SAM-dependent methyltransferase